MDDDDGEADAAAAPPKRPNRAWLKYLLAFMILAMLAGGGLLWYRHMRAATAEARLAARIAAAITAQAVQHAQDGKSYDEIALVDWIRRCLATTLASHDWPVANGLADAGGPAIVAAAEQSCLRTRLGEIATKEVIAAEAARQAGDDQAAIVDIRKQDDLLHFVVGFARLHGYAIPDEFQIFRSDSGIDKTFDSIGHTTPAPANGTGSWQR